MRRIFVLSLVMTFSIASLAFAAQRKASCNAGGDRARASCVKPSQSPTDGELKELRLNELQNKRNTAENQIVKLQESQGEASEETVDNIKP